MFPHFLQSGPFFRIVSFLQPATNTYLLVVPHIKQSGDQPQKDLAQFGRELESLYFFLWFHSFFLEIWRHLFFQIQKKPLTNMFLGGMAKIRQTKKRTAW